MFIVAHIFFFFRFRKLCKTLVFLCLCNQKSPVNVTVLFQKISKAELMLQTQHDPLSTLTSCDLRKLLLFPVVSDTFLNCDANAGAQAFGHNRS